MKRIYKVTLFCVIYIFIVTQNIVYAEYSERKDVLILHSYHYGFEWTDDIQTGINFVLNKNHNDINMQIEYMDMLGMYGEHHFERLVELYKHKYKNRKFDVIISSDNEAFEFLLKYKKELFPNTSIVFSGVNDFESYTLADVDNISGITEKIDIKSNIELILEINPGIDNIIAIMDDTTIGEKLNKDLNQVIEENDFDVQVISIKGKSLEKVIEEINKLSENSAVLFMSTVFKESKERRIYSVKGLETLRKSINIPIYGCWDTLLNNGAIGGKVTNGFYQGQYAGEMAIKILNGEQTEHIPVKKGEGIKFIFDYNQLRAFGINLSQIPDGSDIINKPASVYLIAKSELKQTTIFLVSIFMIIIILLIINTLKRKKVEVSLKESREILNENLEFLKILLDTVPAPIFYRDIKGRYLEVNTAFTEFLGMKKEKIINHTLFSINDDEAAEKYRKEDIGLMKNREKITYEEKIKYSDGEYHDVIFTKAALVTNQKKIKGVVGVMVDITERKKLEEELKKLSTTDQLTKIYNRMKFDEALNEEINRVKRYGGNLSIIMLDIDYFKKINDTYGHDVGDDVLINLTKLVKELTRNTDVFARWGGEEFMILAKNTDIDQAEFLAERIRNKIQQYSFGKVQSVTLSLGVTDFRENDNMETFIKRVDDALYESKKSGRNCVAVK